MASGQAHPYDSSELPHPQETPCCPEMGPAGPGLLGQLQAATQRGLAGRSGEGNGRAADQAVQAQAAGSSEPDTGRAVGRLGFAEQGLRPLPARAGSYPFLPNPTF